MSQLTARGQIRTDELGAASTTTVKTGKGRVAAVTVLVAGSTTGTIYDNTAASGTRLFIIPNTVGRYDVDTPFTTGVTVVTGTAQVALVTYS